MTDAHQAFGQYMQQETADKLAVMQRHDLGLIIPIVFIAEADSILVDVDNALIADRDTMRITREIAYDAVGAIQAVLAIHHPVFLHQLVKHDIDFARMSHSTEIVLIDGTSQCTDHITAIMP